MSIQSDRPARVLFVCTGNSCRSQMAEALLRHMGGDRFEPASAGTQPAGYIHPLAVEAMQSLGVPMDGQYSKSCGQVADDPHDIVITVCDHAACAVPPEWTGQPARAHWSLPDPSFVPGSPQSRLTAALRVAGTLHDWLARLIELPLDRLERDELERELAQIASDAPATTPHPIDSPQRD